MTFAFYKGLLKEIIISERAVEKEIDLECDIR